MDHRIEAILVLYDGDVLAVLSTGYGKKFIIWIDAIIDVKKCAAIVLIPPNSVLYQHRAEVGRFCSLVNISRQDG